MIPTRTYDVTVVGAGIAGLSLAVNLQKKGLQVLLIENKHIGAGGSGTPLGLVNMATGRFGSKSWKTKATYKSIYALLLEAEEYSDKQFFKNTGVLRPALSPEIASGMKENIEKFDWDPDWCIWVNEKEVKSEYPRIECVEGALWLPKALSVDLPSYLNALLKMFKSKGGICIIDPRWTWTHNNKDGSWNIESNGHIYNTQHLAWCAGLGIHQNDRFSFVKTHPIKGQLAVLRMNETFHPDTSISALGYITSLDGKHVVAGSTYEHNFDSLDPDDFGLDYLKKRLTKAYPSLFLDSEVVSQWAGVRISTPNRMPVIGAHPEYPTEWIFTGLGSKGLLYGAYLAEILSSKISGMKVEIPNKVSVNRFLDD